MESKVEGFIGGPKKSTVMVVPDSDRSFYGCTGGAFMFLAWVRVEHIDASQEPLPIKNEKFEPAATEKAEPAPAPPCAVARPLVDDGPLQRLESGELTIEDAVYFAVRYGNLEDMQAKLAGRVNACLWAELEVVFTLCAVYGHHVDTIIYYFQDYMDRKAAQDNHSTVSVTQPVTEVEEVFHSPERPARVSRVTGPEVAAVRESEPMAPDVSDISAREVSSEVPAPKAPDASEVSAREVSSEAQQCKALAVPGVLQREVSSDEIQEVAEVSAEVKAEVSKVQELEAVVSEEPKAEVPEPEVLTRQVTEAEDPKAEASEVQEPETSQVFEELVEVQSEGEMPEGLAVKPPVPPFTDHHMIDPLAARLGLMPLDSVQEPTPQSEEWTDSHPREWPNGSTMDVSDTLAPEARDENYELLRAKTCMGVGKDCRGHDGGWPRLSFK